MSSKSKRRACDPPVLGSSSGLCCKLSEKYLKFALAFRFHEQPHFCRLQVPCACGCRGVRPLFLVRGALACSRESSGDDTSVALSQQSQHKKSTPKEHFGWNSSKCSIDGSSLLKWSSAMQLSETAVTPCQPVREQLRIFTFGC